MAETQQMHGDGAWSWPCPYCSTSNALEASACVGCGAQLRDPEEDDLFTTVATHNAQMVDPSAPRVKESLWSTDATPEETVAQEVLEPPVQPPASSPAAGTGGSPPSPGGVPPAPQTPTGPFSATAPSPRAEGTPSSPFAAAAPTSPEHIAPAPGGPFGTAGGAPAPEPQTTVIPPRQDPAASQPHAEPRGPGAGGQEQPTHRPTPDEHGLSVAVESLSNHDRERCDTPIAVVGALLGEQEVVLGLVAGHLLGHPAIVAMTSTRVLVANARRWKPLVDQFIPDGELMVHLRHDRDIASVTFVQGQRLTGVDDITDVTAAVDLVERIRAAAARVGRT